MAINFLLSSCASVKQQNLEKNIPQTEDNNSKFYNNYFKNKPISIQEQLRAKKILAFNEASNPTNTIVEKEDFKRSLRNIRNTKKIQFLTRSWAYNRNRCINETSRPRLINVYRCLADPNVPSRYNRFLIPGPDNIATNPNLYNSASLLITNDRSAISKSRRNIDLRRNRLSAIDNEKRPSVRPRGRDLSLTTVRRNNPSSGTSLNNGRTQSPRSARITPAPRSVSPTPVRTRSVSIRSTN